MFTCLLGHHVVSTILFLPITFRSVGGELRGDKSPPKLQALVYDILPSTTAVFSYAIGSKKLSANEQLEGVDRVGGQLRGDKECPFSGVTTSGRVWRKVPESDAGNVMSVLAIDRLISCGSHGLFGNRGICDEL